MAKLMNMTQTWLNVSIWATNQSARFFQQPQTFIPERWLPASHPLHDARFNSDNKAVFKPFSFGPRDCLGKNLAYAEMRLTVARLFWNFDIDLMPDQDDWFTSQQCFFLWRKGPLMVKLRKRAGVE
jgi:cytochrome P450